MPRKKKEQSDNYFKAFPTVLRDLMKENGTTQQELADKLGKSRQAISYYCDGSSSPDWETLVQIAIFFSVTTDYLVGLSGIKSPDPDVQGICNYTGLSEKAVSRIATWNKQVGYDANNEISALFEITETYALFAQVHLYRKYTISAKQHEPDYSAPVIAIMDSAKKYGYKLAGPSELAIMHRTEACDLFRKVIGKIAERGGSDAND